MSYVVVHEKPCTTFVQRGSGVGFWQILHHGKNRSEKRLGALYIPIDRSGTRETKEIRCLLRRVSITVVFDETRVLPSRSAGD